MLVCECCGVEFEKPHRKGPVPRFHNAACRQKAYRERHGQRVGEVRWVTAVDVILNGGLFAPYVEDFWRFVDDKITEDEFRSLFP